MSFVKEIKTFTAGEALAAYRRVKVLSGTTSDPPAVHYADAGEDYIGVTEYAVDSGASVACKLNNFPGTFEIECTVSAAIARGTILYGAADGKVSDASSGTAQGISMEAGVSAAVIEVAPWNVKATTAATVSVADTAEHFTGTTVETALAELAADAKATLTIPISLGSVFLESGAAIGTFADSATGVTPGLNQVSNKEVVLRWNNNSGGTFTKVAFSVPLPADIDGTSAMSVKTLAKMSGATDTPVLVHEVFFGAGDTDCAGTDPEITGGATLTEYSCAIAAADVPEAPSVVTVILGPTDDQAKTDDVLLYAVWLEGVRKKQ